MAEPLKHGPLTGRALHLCIDMQNLFAEATPWRVPWLPRILPFIERIARKFPERNVFTRFVPPASAEALPGMWQHYYRRWPDMLLPCLDPKLIGLVPGLAAIAAFGVTFDKSVYSPFSNPDLCPICAVAAPTV